MAEGSLILLRGLPGSGKSTLAKLLSENGSYPVFSVDDYFTDESTKKYRFDFEKNHIAYKQCEQNTFSKMIEKVPKIFVDNTFTMEWEMEPYFKMAAKNNYRIFVLTVENRHGSANIHSIGIEQLRKMADKYEVVLMPL
ncbi:MAG: AAA family ATPase [Bacteroidia bacterium]